MSAAATAGKPQAKNAKTESIVRMPGEAEKSEPDAVEAVDEPSPIQVGTGHAKPEGFNTDYVEIHGKDPFEFPLNRAFQRPGPEVIKTAEQLKHEYDEAIAFSNDPVGIFIMASTEKNASKTVPCAIGGVGIEIYDPQLGGWISVWECPRGQKVVTKRKYVEVLLNSKTDAKRTEIERIPGQDPKNFLFTDTYFNYPLQIWRDDAPEAKRKAWFLKHASFR